VLRRGRVGDTFGGGAGDELPQRGALGIRARQAVEDGLVQMVTGFRTEAVEQTQTGVVLVAADGRRLDPADGVVVLTGFRPDLSFLSEMRLDLDPVLQRRGRSPPRSTPTCTPAAASASTGPPSWLNRSPPCTWWG
jgi:hypothetical protein